jgi:hypothetical protein
MSPSGAESYSVCSSSPHDGLRVPLMEVRRPHPRPEAAGVAIQVSPPCYGCPWYVSGRQIHEDLDVPLFTDHIRALTASFDSKLADVGNSSDTYADRGLIPVALRESQGRQGSAGQSRPLIDEGQVE